MWVDINKEMKGKLYIKVNPNTKIFILTKYSNDPVNIYTGICAYDSVWNGSRLTEYRNKIPMTQRQLADYLEVSEDTIGNWESGRSKPEILSYEKLKHIFRIFDIECDLFDH
jgi:DNA-binding XRE family transcriptional regulator